LQMELLELQSNTVLKQKFEDVGVPKFYKFLDEANFPSLRQQPVRIIVMFGSTYLCEQLFSLLKVNKSTLRSRMTDEHLRLIMRIVS
ncbi:general transcription factor II, putative, partial [Ixodes scapularis]